LTPTGKGKKTFFKT